MNDLSLYMQLPFIQPPSHFISNGYDWFKIYSSLLSAIFTLIINSSFVSSVDISFRIFNPPLFPIKTSVILPVLFSFLNSFIIILSLSYMISFILGDISFFEQEITNIRNIKIKIF